MRRTPILLVNPPSPRGWTANREGFGGLGAAEPRRRGAFVYPAHLLAEAAGVLEARGAVVRAGDCVLMPIRGPARLFGRLPVLSGGYPAIVRVALATLDHDLAWTARHFAHQENPVVLAGAGLTALRERIEAALPRAGISEGPSGGPAASGLFDGRPGADPGPPDSWPFASWDALPLGRARRLPLYHGRGCVHGCTYCPYVLATGRRHVVRSAERTAEEFAWQVSRHRPKRVVFRDPVFGLDRGSTLALLDRLTVLPKKQRVPFEIESRPEALDPQMLDALASAGCVELKLGVETLEAAPLVTARRLAGAGEVGAYAARAEEIVRRSAERGMAVRVYLMTGLPGATACGDEAARAQFAGHPLVTVKAFDSPDPLARAAMMTATQ